MSNEEEFAHLRQTERVSGPPSIQDHDWQGSLEKWSSENPDWPMVIYIMPNGDVLAKRELVESGFGSTHLAHRAQVVLKVTPKTETQDFRIDLLKDRLGNLEVKGE